MTIIKQYDDCTLEEKAEFDKAIVEANQKEKEWFYKRGYQEIDLMVADAAFKRYLNVEQRFDDNRPFDKAPGFRRIFMMGYFYGRDK